MSEISTYATEIRAREPGQALILCQALLGTANAFAEVGGRSVALVNLGLDRATKALLGGLVTLVTPPATGATAPDAAAQESVGITVGEDGKVSFQYAPSSAAAQEARKLTEEIRKRHAALVMSKAFRHMGYNVQAMESRAQDGELLLALLCETPGSDRKVKVAVGNEGGLMFDFERFRNSTCVTAREETRQALGRLGLDLQPQVRRPKREDDDFRAKSSVGIKV